MERGAAPSMEGAGSLPGGPAPFLLKTYDMVDDASTNHIVSWSASKKSFIVWNPPEFSRILLPTYFKHNNFSSFIRQLNTYGFKKIDAERWQFANDYFVKDQRHLLKNIHRKKPQYSHSQPLSSLGESERAVLDDEVERLLQEKASLESDLCKFKDLGFMIKPQLEELDKRVQDMETRQLRMTSFLASSVGNPSFMKNLVKMIEAFADFSATNKKRRLQGNQLHEEIAESNIVENDNRIRDSYTGHVFHQDFFSKLTLGPSPVSEVNSESLRSSSEDEFSFQRRLPEGDAEGLPRENSFASEGGDIADTGTSIFLSIGSSPQKHLRTEAGLKEDGGHVSCHLTLASFQTNNCRPHSSAGGQCRVDQPCHNQNGKDVESIASQDNSSNGHDTSSSSSDRHMPNCQGISKNQENATPQSQVNDVFWERFLTERNKIYDTEDSSSSSQSYSLDQSNRSHGTRRF